ncbi:hypothetical protein ACFPOD_16200 [Nitratireductor kimnyeongensis]|uniref:Uncharacterized protein n=1 Tax=Nitratireductor kimnyeongensis TaxID=430679 RepID=A0ABW0TBX3_9HYPH|nr:hypothetical protein [Nitratireductor kimnyeongensis]QZZ37123.1 hypothetical protein KW403_08395 [Nitratireductor kimnyeongensis]
MESKYLIFDLKADAKKLSAARFIDWRRQMRAATRGCQDRVAAKAHNRPPIGENRVRSERKLDTIPKQFGSMVRPM